MKSISWLFGRGVAKAFGFAWKVPEEHYAAFRRGALSHEALETRIRASLSRHQEENALDGERLRHFVAGLPPDCEHRFVTTNWNTLLDRALGRHGCGEHEACPRRWVVVNPDAQALPVLPGRVLVHADRFERWVERGLPGL